MRWSNGTKKRMTRAALGLRLFVLLFMAERWRALGSKLLVLSHAQQIALSGFGVPKT